MRGLVADSIAMRTDVDFINKCEQGIQEILFGKNDVSDDSLSRYLGYTMTYSRPGASTRQW